MGGRIFIAGRFHFRKELMVEQPSNNHFSPQSDINRWASSGLFFIYVRLFVQKIFVASRIRTRIGREVGKDVDHLTTTTALQFLSEV